MELGFVREGTLISVLLAFCFNHAFYLAYHGHLYGFEVHCSRKSKKNAELWFIGLIFDRSRKDLYCGAFNCDDLFQMIFFRHQHLRP